MSFNIEANTWTPKLIIAFQLTVWSVVGIMLLRRGATSLCSKTELRNHTPQIQISVGHESELAKDPATEFSRGVFVGRNERESVEQDWNSIENRQRITDRKKERGAYNAGGNGRTPARGQITTVGEWTLAGRTAGAGLMIRKRTTISSRDHDLRSVRDKSIRITTVIKQETNLNNNGTSNSNESATVLQYKRSDFIHPHGENFNKCMDQDPVSCFKAQETKNDKNGTESKRMPLNRIGAGAAILMLAIGVVMLLLGPLIVVLRAIGNRRRTREMLIKARCRNGDLPPTYEEATLMDQVPRYSTLQLDMILESSVSL